MANTIEKLEGKPVRQPPVPDTVSSKPASWTESRAPKPAAAETVSEPKDVRQEFWKPAVSRRGDTTPQAMPPLLCQCGAPYIAGARFCHVCGSDRQSAVVASPASLKATKKDLWRNIVSVRDRLEQSNASLVAFALGLICVIAALGTGFLYSANTLLDWQAVQIWRMEWLLAAIAIFVAGVQLRKI